MQHSNRFGGGASWREVALGLISILVHNKLLLLLVTALCAYVLMMVAGRPLIARLKSLPGMKWSAREDTPDTHLQKHGTPSMGGIGLVGAAIFAYVGVMGLIWGLPYFVIRGPLPAVNITKISVLFSSLPLYVLANALLGWCDDWSKARGNGGLRARTKFAAQCILAVMLLQLLSWIQGIQRSRSGFGWFTFGVHHGLHNLEPIAVGVVLLLILVGTGNAVNLTDGIDGLAAGLALQCGSVLLLIPGHFLLGDLLGLFWAALAGSCLAFLHFNRYPAKIFMGDTGSLALGAALGGACVMGRTLWLLPFIGFIFYIEMLSVVVQVLYFKWTRIRRGTGVRLLRRAPLHHHFELGGWSERCVVATFWGINALTSAVGFWLWSRGALPAYP